MMNNIQDYYQISDRLATSGQPTQEQFELIANSGYQIIINLAMSTSTNALANEGVIVTDLGMVYIQIPVVWENPQIKDVQIFFKTMQSFEDDRVWVHCAKNMRVSCFVYLWQKYVLQLSEAEARSTMDQIWQPTGVWQKLIEQAKTNFS
ncbi:protein tyrosine phosphatase family protein [Pleurocapsa sp. FMAR1]|uniref:protein tyrosine phosphatase family protein n=1 Tax=Pleurocapsa sp. FMAR1 TaxID=3040204 RepID=UPI0029C6D155|nr:protein tyrosine phosphatase family protein [Pleurocapsa sp. FMAR1]